MNLDEHLRLAGGALKNWLIAQCEDSLAVGALWYIGLHALGVPLALLWAGLAAVLQFVPHLGPALGMVGPTVAAAIHWGDWRHPLYVLVIYAGIVVLDTLALQPYIMKRVARVPIWASIMTPIVLLFVLPFWGVGGRYQNPRHLLKREGCDTRKSEENSRSLTPSAKVAAGLGWQLLGRAI